MVHEEQQPREVQTYDTHLIGWVWQFVKPYQRLFWISALLMPLNSVFALAQPYIVKLTIDIFLAHRKVAPPRWLAPMIARVGAGHGLFVMGAIYLVLVLGEFATFYGQFYLTMMVAQYSLSDLRLALFQHVEKLPMAFFDRTPIGRLVSRISTDIDAINDMFASGSLTIFIDFLTLTGIAVIMFMLNPRLALWAFLSIPPLFLIINFFRVRARLVYREIRDRLAAVNAYLAESINGMAVIQLFTREDVSQREFDVLNRKSRDVQMLANIYEAGLFSAVESLSAITVAIILWFGGGDVIRQAISIGTLVAFIDYAQRFFGPLREISNKYTTLQSALAAVDKIERLMLEPITIASPATPKSAGARGGSVVFEHVNFEYRKGEPVLKDLSFSVAPGQKIAIVGPTGSGKTTIMKLLNRFYDVTSGQILVDGIDVREWDLPSLRRAIGLVQQDVFLFAGDIMENVRLGRADLSEEGVRQALARAQALRFVERLPSGLAQQVSERGANLSSGQRQLLSFARALAYDPKILVMDEATSSVDSETERLIQIALDELLADRTALVIAHRLSTIERADRIMVLAGGVLRESGTHDELLKLRGLYYRLFELQYAAIAEPAREAAD
jgi:ATP-binding cassette, subfamily B, multidrug efflux pump